MKLLLVDSDKDMVEMLTGLLKTYGYEVHRAYTSEHAKSEWLKHEPDLVILDSELQGVDTLAMCRDMQRKHDALVMITAEKADAHVEARFLDSGADDFLRKPFFPGQFLAHIRAVSRRVRSTVKARPFSSLTVGPVQVDSQRNIASVGGKTVRLTPTETKLLHFLAINANDVCSAEQIVSHVWGYGEAGDSGLIKAHIRHLREKLEPNPSKPRYIQTVSGVGYSLVRYAVEDEPAVQMQTQAQAQAQTTMVLPVYRPDPPRGLPALPDMSSPGLATEISPA